MLFWWLICPSLFVTHRCGPTWLIHRMCSGTEPSFRRAITPIMQYICDCIVKLHILQIKYLKIICPDFQPIGTQLPRYFSLLIGLFHLLGLNRSSWFSLDTLLSFFRGCSTQRVSTEWVPTQLISALSRSPRQRVDKVARCFYLYILSSASLILNTRSIRLQRVIWGLLELNLSVLWDKFIVFFLEDSGIFIKLYIYAIVWYIN